MGTAPSLLLAVSLKPILWLILKHQRTWIAPLETTNNVVVLFVPGPLSWSPWIWTHTAQFTSEKVTLSFNNQRWNSYSMRGWRRWGEENVGKYQPLSPESVQPGSWALRREAERWGCLGWKDWCQHSPSGYFARPPHPFPELQLLALPPQHLLDFP